MSFAREDLLLLATLSLLVVALAATTRQTRVRGRRLVLVTALRAVILLLLVLAAADPHRSRPAPPPGHRTVVFVADASTSVDAASVAQAVSREVAALGPHDRFGVVAVAGSASWLRPVHARGAQALDADGLARALTDGARSGDRDASRLVLGLRLARAGAPGDGSGELVLVSDGRASEGADALVVEARRLAAAGVGVRAVAVGRSGLDLRVDDLAAHAPWVHEGAGVQLTVRVEACGAAGELEAEVRLLRDGQPRDGWTRRVALHGAPLAVTFTDRADAPGVQRYRAEVRRVAGAGPDAEPRNDAAELALEVRGGPRLLAVRDAPDAAGVVLAALRAAGFVVDEVASGDVPDAAGLERWDGVVLIDVAARPPAAGEAALSEDAQRALLAYARAGGGVLAIGGERSFGPGGYRDRPIEDLLPVRSEPPAWAELPDVLLVLLLDRSGSMGRSAKLEVAKVAVRDAARFLGPRDVLGIIGFRADAAWLVEPTPGAGAVAAIMRGGLPEQAAGGGTDLMPALTLATDTLERSPARVKHVVVLTDGIAPRMTEVLGSVKKLRAGGVTTSTVAVGPDADQIALKDVAAAGGGRHHAAMDLATVPRIVANEAIDATRRSGSTAPFRPRVVRAARALDGVPFDAAPELTGLLPTEPQPGAEVLLAGPDDRPLLAVWDVGAGRCAAWTSDAGARWTRSFAAWEGFVRLLGQVARAVARPPGRVAGDGRVVLGLEGQRLRARALLASAPGDRAPRLELEPLDGGGLASPAPLALHERASGEWVGAGPRPGDGCWRARVVAADGARLAEAVVVLGPARLDEVHASGPDEPVLAAVSAAGQVVSPRPRTEALSLRVPLLLLACLLLAAEVAVRRTA